MEIGCQIQNCPGVASQVIAKDDGIVALRANASISEIRVCLYHYMLLLYSRIRRAEGAPGQAEGA